MTFKPKIDGLLYTRSSCPDPSSPNLTQIITGEFMWGEREGEGGGRVEGWAAELLLLPVTEKWSANTKETLTVGDLVGV